eukprot:2673569-Lingulodinium_polyedra.AAC.1
MLLIATDAFVAGPAPTLLERGQRYIPEEDVVARPTVPDDVRRHPQLCIAEALARRPEGGL